MACSDKWRREISLRQIENQIYTIFGEQTDPDDNIQFIADTLENMDDPFMSAIAKKLKGEK